MNLVRASAGPLLQGVLRIVPVWQIRREFKRAMLFAFVLEQASVQWCVWVDAIVYTECSDRGGVSVVDLRLTSQCTETGLSPY